MSLYGDYIKERLGKEIIEDENGFATYYFVNDSTYIENIYVIPEARKLGIASKYADKIAEITLERGYTRLYGSVVPSASGATESLKVLLSYGFQIESAAQNFIVLVKDLAWAK